MNNHNEMSQIKDQQIIFDTSLENFEQEVLTTSYQRPVLVDFWADWCSPCLFLDPVIKSVVNEYEGTVRLAKLEVDEGENMKLAGQYQVRGFPTVILFEKGKEVSRFSSARPAVFIRDFINQHAGLIE